MATACVSPQVLLVLVAAFLLVSESSPVKVTERRAAGVFMLIEGGSYTFNFTAATAACISMNVTMATRAQVQRAVAQGLETCKFGWIHERMAVIPRIKSDQNCGQGKTGVVPWFASVDTKFAVYCFRAADLVETPQTSTTHPQASVSSTRPTAPTQTPAPTTALPESTSPSVAYEPATAAEQTSAAAAVTLLPGATRSAGTVPAPEPSSPHTPASLHLVTSGPVSERPPSGNSAQRSLAALHTGLVVGGVVLLLTAAAAAVWLHKRRLFGWSEQRLRDDADTEMWKHTDSEMDVHIHREAEAEAEEEAFGLSSSEVRLCVNPHVQSKSSE